MIVRCECGQNTGGFEVVAKTAVIVGILDISLVVVNSMKCRAGVYGDSIWAVSHNRPLKPSVYPASGAHKGRQTHTIFHVQRIEV